MTGDILAGVRGIRKRAEGGRLMMLVVCGDRNLKEHIESQESGIRMICMGIRAQSSPVCHNADQQCLGTSESKNGTAVVLSLCFDAMYKALLSRINRKI